MGPQIPQPTLPPPSGRGAWSQMVASVLNSPSQGWSGAPRNTWPGLFMNILPGLLEASGLSPGDEPPLSSTCGG